MPVTLRLLEKISGIISTPTLSDLAVRKGEGLNFGSSPMERFFAVSEPEKRERLRSPSWTLRPSASEAVCSMVGRKLLTGIRNGATRRRTTMTATMMPMILSERPMETSGELRNGKGLERRTDNTTRRARRERDGRLHCRDASALLCRCNFGDFSNEACIKNHCSLRARANLRNHRGSQLAGCSRVEAPQKRWRDSGNHR